MIRKPTWIDAYKSANPQKERDMENKINIAELLKDCPKGMELDCTLWNKVTLEDVYEGNVYPIKISTPEGKCSLSQYGCYSLNKEAKCVIFPKGKTTWEGFVPPCKFKIGDVLYIDCAEKESDGDVYKYIFILKEIDSLGNYFSYCHLSIDGFFTSSRYLADNRCTPRLATEEEKQKLFDAIKENGYKWNPKTKTLEELSNKDDEKLRKTTIAFLKDFAEQGYENAVECIDWLEKQGEKPQGKIEPKFKVGDKIVEQGSIENSWIVCSVSSEYYGLKLPNGSENIGALHISEQDDWELVPNIFDISTLKPFDKVLVRDCNTFMWNASLFSHIRNKKFFCIGAWYNQCIPYGGNEHLLGTTNDCDDFYKTWE